METLNEFLMPSKHFIASEWSDP